MADAREKALSVLNNIFNEKAYSNIALDNALKHSSLDSRDRAFVTNIVYGVLTNLTYLDNQISAYSKLPINKMSYKVCNILRMSLYQICFMDRVPDSAAVNEGVILAKKAVVKSAGFVNAVLRAFLKGGEALPSAENELRYLAVKYSYPEWIVKMWLDRFAREECESLLAAGNMLAPVTVRVNTNKISVRELAGRLDARPGKVEGALEILGRGNVTDIEGFKEGLFTVQDAAAQKVTLILAPEKGDRVLDMCAAPGGKTTHISELIGNSGAVVAWDKHPHKMALIEKAARRLGLENITAYVHDARETDANLFEGFDKVLLDAPCSGLGIIRKKPDIKWLRQESDIAALCEEQKSLLHASAYYVKPGGRLVYSTCTISEAENEEMVKSFLEMHTNFSQESQLTMYPHKDETDGFFICSMIRSI